MIIRMYHIERQSNFRANLYVEYLNTLKRENKSASDKYFTTSDGGQLPMMPYLHEYFQTGLQEFEEDYEHRSIKSMLRFFAHINIGAWFLLMIWKGIEVSTEVNYMDISITLPLVPIGIAVVFIIYLIYSWSRP